jgi:hypothetical protein
MLGLAIGPPLAMAESKKVGPKRDHLNFMLAVRNHFAFLEESGFRVVEALPTIMRYGCGDLVAIVYHGRSSFELGLEAGREGEMYSMSELIRALDAVSGHSYRNFVATTEEQVQSGIQRLAELVKRHAEPLLRGDEGFFASLSLGRGTWAESYALDVLARQLRPQATEAFRQGRYDEAAELFERILPRLSPAERLKYDLARERSERRPGTDPCA